MIGNLLRTAASTFTHQGSSRPQTPLESVTEEAHTRDLLFPDVNALRTGLQNELPFQSARPATARDAVNYDDRGSLDISYPADIRIIIAQDVSSRHHQPQVLFDSKPHKSSDSRTGSPLHEQDPTGKQTLLSRGKSMTSPSKRGHTPTHSLFSGTQIAPLSPTSPRSPDARPRTFFGDRSRAPAFDFGASEHETTQGKLAREAKEETDALLGCMFGAPGFKLEPSTKLHVVPKKNPDGAKSPGGTRPISSGGFNRRRTPLVRSTSAADFSNGWSPSGSSDTTDSRHSGSKPAVMVTRLFSVKLPESGSAEYEEDGQAMAPAPPSNLADSLAAQKGGQTKQKKVPMYAIAVVLQLPPDGAPARVRPSASQQGLSSLGSSLNDSTPANSWRAEHSAFSSFMELRSQMSLDSVLNPHIALVMQHWNVVSRSIELLEIFTKHKLKILLEQCAPPPPFIAPAPKPGLVKAKKPKQQSQRSVYVLPECFQKDQQIKKSTETAAQTIVGGLRTRCVVVGQGRWGAWREEARWVGRWAGGRDQNFFFFNFLTAFLGSHTAWLESLSPAWYRRRHATQQRIQGKDSGKIRNRTVIVASDKMAARRLIFLLATFFPSNFNHAQPFAPNLSTSHPQNVQYSESPPMQLLTRDLSLRRSATAQRAGTSKKPSGERHGRTVSFSLMEAIPNDSESAISEIYAPHERRGSGAKSLRSPSLAIPRRAPDSRKASLSTVTADAAEAVPHFSTLTTGNPSSPAAEKRPGSGGSMASNALSQNLKRSESSNLSTSASGRWGSVLSDFWGNRRDSTDESDALASSQDSPTRRRPEHRKSAGKLGDMVVEIDMAPGLRSTNASPQATMLPRRLEDCLIKPQLPAYNEGGSMARSIPHRPKPERLPLKLSFNENEGYIDVAMPAIQSFSSSLASSFASIRLPNHPMINSQEHYSPYGSVVSDSPHPHPEPNVDIAGWLKTYHRDFTVQAVKPYDRLLADVKASMYAEAQLLSNNFHEQDEDQASSNGWEDVCTTLLADTTSFTVSRLRLRRRRRTSPVHSTPTTPTTPIRAPTVDPNFEIEIVTEPVMDLDATLIDAVERVLAQSGTSSRAQSRAQSQAPSRAQSRAPSRAPSRPASPPRSPRPDSVRSGRNGSDRTTGTYRRDGLSLDASMGPGHIEVPHVECKRMVLGALEEVVRSVVEEREEEERGGKTERDRGDSWGTNADSERHAADGATSGSERSRKDSLRGKPKRREMDSTLREGVRRWLVGVEEGW
ncbi:MAG: hypothetical protein MMC23_006716 [Stictis urceolatum]|nr:hypothetical protein [Stictis urceolata]